MKINADRPEIILDLSFWSITSKSPSNLACLERWQDIAKYYVCT